MINVFKRLNRELLTALGCFEFVKQIGNGTTVLKLSSLKEPLPVYIAKWGKYVFSLHKNCSNFLVFQSYVFIFSEIHRYLIRSFPESLILFSSLEGYPPPCVKVRKIKLKK